MCPEGPIAGASYRTAQRIVRTLSPVFNYDVHHTSDNNCRGPQRSNVTLIVIAPVTIGSGIILARVRRQAPAPSMIVNAKIDTGCKNES